MGLGCCSAVWAMQWNGSEEEGRILHIREGDEGVH